MTSRQPLAVIVTCLVVTALGSTGLPFLKMENNGVKLWIPQVGFLYYKVYNYRYIFREVILFSIIIGFGTIFHPNSDNIQ